MQINSNQMLVFKGRGKQDYPGENLSVQSRENQQTQPTYAAESGIEPARRHSDGRRVFSLPRHPRTWCKEHWKVVERNLNSDDMKGKEAMKERMDKV